MILKSFNLSWGCLPEKYLTDQKIAEITPNSVFTELPKEELKLPQWKLKRYQLSHLICNLRFIQR